jgi:hypothetical protein
VEWTSGRGNRSIGKKPTPVLLWPLQIPHLPSPGLEPGPPLWEACDQPELRNGQHYSYGVATGLWAGRQGCDSSLVYSVHIGCGKYPALGSLFGVKPWEREADH